MRCLSFGVLLVVTLFASRARADLGPPPKCEGGAHQEYLYGHHCVPDGFHLATDPSGKIVTVKDGEAPPTTATPTATTTTTSSATTSVTASDTSSATGAPTPKPVATSMSVPEKKSGCVYGAGASSEGGWMLALLVALTACRRARG